MRRDEDESGIFCDVNRGRSFFSAKVYTLGDEISLAFL